MITLKLKCPACHSNMAGISKKLYCGDEVCQQCYDKSLSSKECPVCLKSLTLNLKGSKIEPFKLEEDEGNNDSEEDESNDKEETEPHREPHNDKGKHKKQEKNSNKGSESDDELSESNDQKIRDLTMEYCRIHPSKQIEYFCKTCSKVVCVACIYTEHNGHHLSLFEEVTSNIKSNLRESGRMLEGVLKINNDNSNTLKARLDEVASIRKHQVILVDKAFTEIYKKLEEKKAEIINEFNKKYTKEEQRFRALENYLLNSKKESAKMYECNTRLLRVAEKSVDAKVLKVVDDFTSFIHHALVDIKKLYEKELSIKMNLKLNNNIKPILISTRNFIINIERVKVEGICYPENSDHFDTMQNLKYNRQVTRQNSGTPSANDFLEFKENDIVSRDSSFSRDREKTERVVYPNISDKGIGIGSEQKISNLPPGIPSMDRTNRPRNIPIDKKKATLLPVNAVLAGKSGQDANYDKLSNLNLVTVNQDKLKSDDEINKDPEKPQHRKSIAPISRKRSFKGESPLSKRSLSQASEKEKEKPYDKFVLKTEEAKSSFKDRERDSREKLSIVQDYRTEPSKNEIRGKDTVAAIVSEEVAGFVNGYDYPPVILCIGDSKNILKLDLGTLKWKVIQLDEKSSHYFGGLKYSSLCALSNQNFLLTGGVKIQNNEPSNQCYEFTANSGYNQSIATRNMNKKRYGHGSVFLNNCVYVIGGYNHKDENKIQSVTLKQCEKYNIDTRKWEHIANLNQARVYFGIAVYNKESIFVFGGFHDKNILNSIEKYEIMSDNWITYFLKLPSPLSKIAALCVDERIYIFGGITDSYTITNDVWRLDMKESQWIKQEEMKSARSFNQSAIYFQDKVYVIGGNLESNCECFSVKFNKWDMIESYTSVVKGKPKFELHNYSFSINVLE